MGRGRWTRKRRTKHAKSLDAAQAFGLTSLCHQLASPLMTIAERTRALACAHTPIHCTHTSVHTYPHSLARVRDRRRGSGIHKEVLCPHWVAHPLRFHPTRRITRAQRLCCATVVCPTLVLCFSPSASQQILIFIVDRLTAAERAFSTPSPRPLGQSARASPAILVHAEAARTCIFSSSSLHRYGSPRRVCLVDVCVCLQLCVRARARASARERVFIEAEGFPLGTERRARMLGCISSAGAMRACRRFI